ncbi:major facilitator superfamily domain-containing protein 12-like isoform X2 [Mya arenaria]|uniref:major facilitator superfamily domain-containing protein 12-like isoform X2 n=1 Tax=Mya arenaria TaxID=6604 RepID=UPI0022E53D47|nr:major facilitator superfamily domain-containing protein 12-like isoform X2 [Mya arenaria]
MSEKTPLLGGKGGGRLSMGQKFAYSVGHVLNDLTASMWFSYMIIYFHQVKSFNNGLAGDLVLIGQISDAIFTPFIGYESDRVKGCFNMGKRKTWHFIGTLCVALSFPFLFVGCITCDDAQDIPQFMYYAPFVVIFQFGWAATQINHLSLIPDLTDCQNERTGLNGSRYAFTVLSNIVVYGIAWLIFDLGQSGSDKLSFEDKEKFRLLVLIVVGIGVLFSVIFHIGVREHPKEYREHGDSFSSTTNLSSLEKSTLKKLSMSWKCWLKEHQFYQVALIYMSTRLVVNVSQVYLPMYITETIMMDKDSIAIIPLIVYVSGFVTSLAMKYTNKLFGRKMTYLMGIVFTAGASVAFYLLPQGSKLVYLPAVLSGIGGSTMLVTSLAMTADLIKDNTESSAFVYGAMSFTDKLSNGAAIAIIQQLHPCPEHTFKQYPWNTGGCCPACVEYFRSVMTWVPGGFATLAFIALMTLLPQTLGHRSKQAAVLKPVLSRNKNREIMVNGNGTRDCIVPDASYESEDGEHEVEEIGYISEEEENCYNSEKAENGYISGKAENSTVSKEAENGSISETAENCYNSEKEENVCISKEAENGSISETAENCYNSEKEENGCISEEARNGYISEEAINGSISGEARNGSISEDAGNMEARNSLISEDAGNEEARNGYISEEARNGSISEEARNGLISEEVGNEEERNANIPKEAENGFISEQAGNG